MADAADAFRREGRFDGAGKSEQVIETGPLFIGLDFPDALNVLPYFLRRSLDGDLRVDGTDSLRQAELMLHRGRHKRQQGKEGEQRKIILLNSSVLEDQRRDEAADARH